jgi:hypothetical protein
MKPKLKNRKDMKIGEERDRWEGREGRRHGWR